MEELSRLDVLIYAHDGRGLGHVSRSVGIGLALRRLYPGLKVLFVSGSNFSKELIGEAPLDWLKLPSYKTCVIDGKSTGVPGDSLFSDKELGVFRSKSLSHLVRLYRPRVILVDHTPQGKHRELVEALQQSRMMGESEKSIWVLGVRGVVGEVAQVTSGLARELFEKYFSHLLWYGDSNILGDDHMEHLAGLYGVAPCECGYVLRLAEYLEFNTVEARESTNYCGTVSIPWQGEGTGAFLQSLFGAVQTLGAEVGEWKIFLGEDGGAANRDSASLLSGLKNCSVEAPSSKYIPSLLHSRSAVIYGGYNSLMDVLYAGVSALVILREMKDDEQQIHLRRLQKVVGERLKVVSESDVSQDLLAELLQANLHIGSKSSVGIALNGAERAARLIRSVL